MSSPSFARVVVLIPCLLGLAVVSPVERAPAQSLGGMIERNVRNSVGDIWGVWVSPVHAKPRDWLLTVGAFGLAAAVSPLDDEVDRWAVRHRDDNGLDFLSPFREGGDAFSGKTVTPIAAGVLVLSFVTKNEKMQDGVFGCLSSYLASYGVRHFVAYPLVSRVRPDSSRSNPGPPAKQGDQYEIDVPGGKDWGKRSFPGGHVANITTCASFLSKRFEMGVFEVVPWAIVGSVGVSRVLDRRHWLSDQTIGLLFGYAVGKEVAIRSLRRRGGSSSSSSDASGVFLEPAQEGVRMGWRREF